MPSVIKIGLFKVRVTCIGGNARFLADPVVDEAWKPRENLRYAQNQRVQKKEGRKMQLRIRIRKKMKDVKIVRGKGPKMCGL